MLLPFRIGYPLSRSRLALRVREASKRRSMKKIVLLVTVLLVVWRSRPTLVVACNDDGHQHNGTESSKFDQTYLRADRNLQDVSIDEEECGFQEPSEEQMEMDSANMKRWKAERSRNGVQKRTESYVIPVYFHIIQPTFASGLVGSDRIEQYMEYLNDSFQNSSAPFYFRYGNTSRTIEPTWADDCASHSVEYAFKSKLKVGGSDILNVYICNSIPRINGASLAGYTYNPNPSSDSDVKDGIVLARSTSDRRLNTLVHEVGHYFGLYHTFGANTCDPTSRGDEVEDTPQHLSRAQVNCKTNPLEWDTCPGLPGVDPVDNFMTYSTDNFCRTKFTPGQVQRMLAQYEMYRYKGPSRSPTLSPTDTPSTAPISVPPSNPSSAPSQSNSSLQNTVTNQTALAECASFMTRCSSHDECCSGNCLSTLGVFIYCW